MEISAEIRPSICGPDARLKFTAQDPSPAEFCCSKLIRPLVLPLERKSFIREIFIGPSMEDGVLLVNETDAIPGAFAMDAASEGPSKSGAPGFAVPESAASLVIKADIPGFNSALIPRSACPFSISDPLIREAQEVKNSNNAVTRKIFFIIMLTITKMKANGNMGEEWDQGLGEDNEKGRGRCLVYIFSFRLTLSFNNANKYIRNEMFTVDLFLQIWGGIGYLLAKILLAVAEGMNNGRKLRIIGWFSYLLGIPAWVILLAGKNNWVVAAIDLGSVPSMILGIVIAWKQNNQINKMADIFVKAFTFLMIITGTFYSVYYFHGITTFSQILEILITFGFLSGSYLLAKNNPNGWLLFALMCTCMGILMLIQDKVILVFQQGISLVVVIVGYIRAIKKQIKND